MNKNYFLYLIVFSFISSINAQITTNNTTYSSEQLIEDVLNGGATCVTITNVQSYTGTSVNGIAYFEKNGTNFPFENGIILSTGNAMEAPGPNDEVLSGQEIGWNGDVDLEHATGDVNSINASYIEFDFVPTENEISFRFILASEHYNKNNECPNTESLAFILTNLVAGDSSSNLAVLPASYTFTDFVSTDNIHTVLPSICIDANEQYFSHYNFDDTDSSIAQNSAIEFGGQTVPITAFANVIPGDVYHLKLVISDLGSLQLDSAVFIEGGSFNSCPPPAPPISNDIVNLYPSFADEKVSISASLKMEEIIVINMLGAVVDSVNPNSKEFVLDVTEFKSGIYFVSISMNGVKKIKRIVRK